MSISDLKNHYISNCIKRIIAAECDDRNVGKRAEDITQAIYLAQDSLDGARKYLIRLCDEAEAGKYAAK